MTLDTLGFFTRSVQDLESLADLFLMKDDDPVSEEPFKLEGAKFGFYKSHYWLNAGPGTVKAMDTAKQILEKHGAIAEDIELPEDFAKVLDWHSAVGTGEGRSSYLGQYRTDKTLLHEDIINLVENKKGFSRKDQLEAYDNCARLRPVFDEKANQYAAIITPSVVDEAPLGYNTGDMVCHSLLPRLRYTNFRS